MNYVKLILVLIVQLSLIRQQARTAEIKTFRCDTTEKVNDTLAGVKRMTINKDRIYIICQHKIISFRIPTVLTNRYGSRYFVSGPVLEQQAEEVEPKGSNRSVGNVMLYDSSETLEILHSGLRELSARRLDFDGAVPGKRTEKQWKLNASLPFNYRRVFDGNKDDYATMNFIYVFVASLSDMRTLYLEYLTNYISVGVIGSKDGTEVTAYGGARLYNIDYGK